MRRLKNEKRWYTVDKLPKSAVLLTVFAKKHLSIYQNPIDIVYKYLQRGCDTSKRCSINLQDYDIITYQGSNYIISKKVYKSLKKETWKN